MGATATIILYAALAIAGAAAVAWAARASLVRALPREGAEAMRAAPPTVAFGLLVVLIYALAAIFAPAIAPYGQAEAFDALNALPGDDPRFPLGTDQMGRDVLTRLIYGARNTVGIALAAACLAVLIGAACGLLAAALGGLLDRVLRRAVDMLTAIPELIFALLLIAILGHSTLTMILVVAALDATRVFGLARAAGVSVAGTGYIESAKLRGESLSYVIFGEMLPNAAAPLAAAFGRRFCVVLLTIAALSFLGVGIQPPLADWGTMARELGGRIDHAAAPGALLAAASPLLPAAAIALLALAVNFVVDGMRRPAGGPEE